MTSKALPLLTCEAHPLKGSRKGQSRVFFEITPAGRTALETLCSINADLAKIRAPITTHRSTPTKEPGRPQRVRDMRWTRGGVGWTADEDVYLRESWGKVSLDAICEHLSRSPGSVKQHAIIIGLRMSS